MTDDESEAFRLAWQELNEIDRMAGLEPVEDDPDKGIATCAEHRNTLRDCVMFCAGIFGVIQHVVFSPHANPTLLVFFISMAGLPAVLSGSGEETDDTGPR